MSRGKIIRTRRADADLIDIWVGIATDDRAAADRHLDRIDKVLGLLATMPGIGARRDDVKPGLRIHPVRPHLILYMEISSGIRVLRVIHGSRRWADHV